MLLERVPGADEIIFATHCHNDLGMATANSLAAVEAGARQIECTINGLGERAGNTALEEVVMALKVRNDIMPYPHRHRQHQDHEHLAPGCRCQGFAVQFNKAIVGKNAFAHESGIHQDGMLKNAETFEIMRPEDVGLTETNIVMGKHSGRAALRSKLENLGFELGDNQLKDVFVRFKELADRKKEIYDDDLIALMRTAPIRRRPHQAQVDARRLRHRGSAAGRHGPEVDGSEHATTRPATARWMPRSTAIKALVPHDARLQLYQVHAVTEGTDAQATVSVRMEEDGRIVTGQSADTDTVVASVRAYIHALNRLLVRREKRARCRQRERSATKT